jgi:hypothetical protein
MRWTLLALLVLSLATGTAGAVPAAVPVPSAEALLAADVPWSTVQQVAGKGWWPEAPSFDTVVYQDDPMPAAAVTQTFVDTRGGGEIRTSLYAYPGARDSSVYLSNATLVGDVIDRDRPAVGQEHAYYVATLPDRSRATRFSFTRGPVAVAVQASGAWSRERIAKLARPIDERLQQLLAGKLAAPTIPAAQLARLPRAGAAPGRVLGTALIPAESWAAIVRKGNKLRLRDSLVVSGNRTLLFRRYLRDGSRTEVLETTLFAFPNAGAAGAFVAPFRAGVQRSEKTRLDPGSTGGRSAFRYEFTNYELQFAAGRFVGDVFCWAPFQAEPSKACEDAARQLAERWYAQLSRSS